MMPRELQFVQLCASASTLYALDAKGGVWQLSTTCDGERWRQVKASLPDYASSMGGVAFKEEAA